MASAGVIVPARVEQEVIYASISRNMVGGIVKIKPIKANGVTITDAFQPDPLLRWRMDIEKFWSGKDAL